ncbi:MAG: helix-turn-helix domain-containing protein [Pseudomonadota bacterium]
MTGTRIGYARCSTDGQDLDAKRAALIGLGVADDHIYTDHGLTGANRERPGLSQAELRRMSDTGEYSISDLAELFDVSRPTVYRVLRRIPTSAAL